MPERRDESIRIEYLPLSALLKAPRNPKDHDIPLLHGTSNQATILGGWNENLLAELLREHAGIEAGLVGMGFSEADVVDLLLKAANANETQHDEPAWDISPIC